MSCTRWVLALLFVLIVPIAARADRVISTDFTQNGGTFAVSPTGTLTISSLTNPLLTLQGGATTSGIQNISIGNSPNEKGQLLVQQGSVLTNSVFAYLGNPGATGVATVTGTGSQWQANFLILDGTATLNVENGGLVTANSSSVLGLGAGSNDTINITGAGSELRARMLGVGIAGAGTLNVNNGGLVSSSIAGLGQNPGSSGTATVTGAGSKWQISGVMNINANSTLDVNNGGLVIAGQVTAMGAGAKWQNSGSIYVNGDYTYMSDATGVASVILVDNGGVVETGGVVVIGAKGKLGGGGGGTIIGDVINNGSISSFGHNGVLNIDGDLTSSGLIKFVLGGTTSGLFDQLFVTDDVGMGGVIEIDLLSGFNPVAGDSFKLLDFSSFTNAGYTFDFSHASLGSGLVWDTSTFSVDGTVHVAVPEASSFALAGVATLAGLFAWRKKGALKVLQARSNPKPFASL